MNLEDSGDRTPQHGGAMRDRAPGKGRFDLLSPYFLHEMARLAEAGAAKYETRNWEKGYSTALCADSAFRHLIQYLGGDRTEDHLVAVAWNAMAAWHITKMVEDGHLPSDLINHLPLHVNNLVSNPSLAEPLGGDYTVEIGGQVFSREQWEAVRTYVAGPPLETITVEDVCKHCRNRVYFVRASWHDDAPDPALCHSSPTGSHEPGAGKDTCARCGSLESNHGPGGSRSYCSFAGKGTVSTCRNCDHVITWDGFSRWEDGHHAVVCRDSKDPDPLHVPGDAGDYR